MEGGRFEAVTELEASCTNKDVSGKLPVWKIDGVSLSDSADISCKDGSKCVDPPLAFGNSLLLSDFDGEKHDNGTTFKLVCPTNQTGNFSKLYSFKSLIFDVLFQCLSTTTSPHLHFPKEKC